jgi:hypothetical protein
MINLPAMLAQFCDVRLAGDEPATCMTGMSCHRDSVESSPLVARWCQRICRFDDQNARWHCTVL